MAGDAGTKLTVLWATDGSQHARSAIPLLRQLVLPATGRLVALAVAPHALLSGARPDPSYLSNVTRTARARSLTEARRAAEDDVTALDPDSPVEVSVRWGHPIEEILRMANSVRADLVVVGAKGHSNLHLMLLGSVTTGIAQLTTRALLIARPGSAALKTVVIGYHGSAAARRALRFLSRLGPLAGVQLVLVNVIEPFTLPEGTPPAYRRMALAEAHKINERRHRDAARALDAVTSDLREQGLHVTYEVLSGDAGPQLDGAARKHNADLIVVGSRKPSAARHYLMGSTAEKLVRHAHTSVLVVR